MNCRQSAQHRDGGSRRGRWLAGLLVLVVLTACADDESDRQFAGEEQSTFPIQETVTTVVTVPGPATPVVFASPLADDAMLAVRGSQEALAIAAGGDVWLYDAGQNAILPMPLPENFQAWHAKVAPDQEHVAVLGSPGRSLQQWTLLVFGRDGELQSETVIVGGKGSPIAVSDVVATGTGGLDWRPDGRGVAAALPTGGIYSISVDGDVEEMSPPRRTSRPGDVAWSPVDQALAFGSQPGPKDGLGIYMAPTGAFPLDAVQVLKPDNTGNRSASHLAWAPDGSQVFVIIERKETGGKKGEVFSIDAAGGAPALIWSPDIRESTRGATAISLSPDGTILAIVTGSEDGDSVLIFRQVDGVSEIQRSLGAGLEHPAVIWTEKGVVVGGIEQHEGGEPLPVVVIVDPEGRVSQAIPQATPIPSPVTSPQPAATPATVLADD